MRLAVVLVVLALLVFPCVALAQEQSSTQAQGSTQTQGTVQTQASDQAQGAAQQSPADYGTVRPVSPREFTDKVNRFVGEVNGMLAGTIVPLAMFAMLVSAAALALGSVIGMRAVSRFGWGGLVLSAMGLLVFWGMPVIFGLIKSLAGYFSQ